MINVRYYKKVSANSPKCIIITILYDIILFDVLGTFLYKWTGQTQCAHHEGGIYAHRPFDTIADNGSRPCAGCL